jgi:excisionase family DNA binding protein
MGVSRQTVYALIAAGKLKSLRLGRARLVPVQSILALAQTGGVPNLDAAISQTAVRAERPLRRKQRDRKKT